MWIESNIQMYFNSQPHEEADDENGVLIPAIGNFNSQPHEEADWYSCFKTSEGGISTHSLTRRLTLLGIPVCF